MSMELEIAPRKFGRAPVDLDFAVERALTPDDAGALNEERGVKSSPLRRITDRHHMLARLLAAGQTCNEAALIAEYHPNRVNILKNDPAFKELIEFYRSQKDREFRDVAAKLAGITSDALDLIEERLEDEVERAKISTMQALEIVKVGADRSGFGPSSSTTAVNVHIGLAERMEAKRRAAREAAMTLIEAPPNE